VRLINILTAACNAALVVLFLQEDKHLAAIFAFFGTINIYLAVVAKVEKAVLEIKLSIEESGKS
jgi:hypothetical protein